jgi:hypothetical protein
VTALNTLTTLSTWKQNINSKMLYHTGKHTAAYSHAWYCSQHEQSFCIAVTSKHGISQPDIRAYLIQAWGRQQLWKQVYHLMTK